MQKRAVASLSLKALAHNFARVKALAPESQILAMVKANAYGHGLLPMAQHLSEADYLGVASLEEAIMLRQAGITKTIVLMSGFHSVAELELLVYYRVQPVVYDWQQIMMLSQYRTDYRFMVWLKVDTGMHRLGFAMTEARGAAQSLSHCAAVEKITWLTHFACANEQDQAFTLQQIKHFDAVTSDVTQPKSAANSAALMHYPQSCYQVVRPGLMLYGVSPLDYIEAKDLDLRPVMSLRAKIISLKTVWPGESVGYGATWHAERQSKIATVSIGYGDGYPQYAPSGTRVLIRGQQVPTAGRVSMDTMAVDVSDLLDVAVGDEVILWGEGLSVESVAKQLGVSVYALLTGVSSRVMRECVEGLTDNSEVAA